MSKKTISISGSWTAGNLQGMVDNAIMAGLNDTGEFILDESNKDVPHDEGILQASGIVSEDKSKRMVAVSYDTPYARRLHEHPNMRFQKSRKGKWLEDNLIRHKQKLIDHVKARISRIL